VAKVELRDVVKAFEGNRILHGVSLTADTGQLLVLVGPSGCGKTTIIRLVAGLETIDDGEIRIDGRVVNEVHPRDRDIAMVFQNYALYPDKTAYDNMAFGLRMRGASRTEIERRVRGAAEILGIAELMQRKPRQLSGGQRQRVALGRAIVRDPKVFLFDEPLSNLDAHLRVHMRTEIVKLHQRLGSTMIYVTHDQIEAMTMGDVIAVIDRGRIMQVGSPLELYRRPRNVFVARFIGSPVMNVLPTRLSRQDGTLSLALGEVSAPLPSENAARLRRYGKPEVLFGIRPEDVSLAAAHSPGIPARIAVVEHLGAQSQLDLSMGEVNLTAIVPANDKLRAGQEVRIGLALANAHFFDSETQASVEAGA
jgi:multiple sugar transport system ATP-binding protein